MALHSFMSHSPDDWGAADEDWDGARGLEVVDAYCVAYLNSGSVRSASFVPPGSITLLSASFRLP
jgi:hypothetical protein